MNRLFLLGGYDLEMVTIRQLLVDAGEKFYDLHLTWESATLSSYFDYYRDLNDTQIIGVELYEDIKLPVNYISIDHHNSHPCTPSAIEQVASLLGIKLNRWQQLVAANDSGYIPAMLQIGATTSEIETIRQADRQAQGVTPQEEQWAEQCIDKKQICHGITVVHTKCRHFSPITDRMYPYNRLLIYSQDSIVYYGNGCSSLISYYELEIEKGIAFYGGGENGFFGFTKEFVQTIDVENQVENILKIVGV